jgi:hypothetical protein
VLLVPLKGGLKFSLQYATPSSVEFAIPPIHRVVLPSFIRKTEATAEELVQDTVVMYIRLLGTAALISVSAVFEIVPEHATNVSPAGASVVI